MNYKEVLLTSWKITWNNKYLWGLGFLAALTVKSTNLSNMYGRGSKWLLQNLEGLTSAQNLIPLTILLISLIAWILSTLARIGLISDVNAFDINEDKPIRHLLGTLQASKRYLIPILAMQLLVWTPVIILSGLWGVLPQSFFAEPSSDPRQLNPFHSGETASIYWLMSCSTMIFSFLLPFIDAFAFRSLILNKSSVKDSIFHSITLLKENPAPIFGLAVICTIVGLIFSFIVAFISLPILVLVTVPVFDSTSQCMANNGGFDEISYCLQLESDPNAIPYLIISTIIISALIAVWVTYQSAVFTIAFDRFRQKSWQGM